MQVISYSSSSQYHKQGKAYRTNDNTPKKAVILFLHLGNNNGWHVHGCIDRDNFRLLINVQRNGIIVLYRNGSGYAVFIVPKRNLPTPNQWQHIIERPARQPLFHVQYIAAVAHQFRMPLNQACQPLLGRAAN